MITKKSNEVDLITLLDGDYRIAHSPDIENLFRQSVTCYSILEELGAFYKKTKSSIRIPVIHKSDPVIIAKFDLNSAYLNYKKSTADVLPFINFKYEDLAIFHEGIHETYLFFFTEYESLEDAQNHILDCTDKYFKLKAFT